MSKKVDCYSFGVLVWEMYCGCRPFAGMVGVWCAGVLALRQHHMLCCAVVLSSRHTYTLCVR
jgi:hypothetical protein